MLGENIIIPDRFIQQQNGQQVVGQVVPPPSVQEKINNHITAGQQLLELLNDAQANRQDDEDDFELLVISTLQWLVECNLPIEVK